MERRGTFMLNTIHTIDTGPLLQRLRTRTQHQSVQKRPGSQKPLVLENADSEVDVVHTVSLLGGLDLNESLGLEGSEFVLHLGGLSRCGSEVGEVLKTFLLAAWSERCAGDMKGPKKGAMKRQGSLRGQQRGHR